MKILITGADGMVARAAASYCRSIDDNVLPLSRRQLDIADRNAVIDALNTLQPDAVLNCAAFTDVDGAESAPEAAAVANTLGVKNLAEAAAEVGSRFITISTDYVFDGSNPGFYTEDHTPRPRGVYAMTKYDGEVAAAHANANAVIVRSGWVYGSGGTNFLSVIPRLLDEGKTIKAISNSFGTPTFAGDLARRLRELAGGVASGVFHVTNSGTGTSYLGFAEKVCELGAYDKALVEPVLNEDLKRPAPRPVSSKLASIRGLSPLPHWVDALAEFLIAVNGKR